LKAKLDLGNKTEECHGLTASTSREKRLGHRSGKKANRLQAKPMETTKQALQNA